MPSHRPTAYTNYRVEKNVNIWKEYLGKSYKEFEIPEKSRRTRSLEKKGDKVFEKFYIKKQRYVG